MVNASSPRTMVTEVGIDSLLKQSRLLGCEEYALGEVLQRDAIPCVEKKLLEWFSMFQQS